MMKRKLTLISALLAAVMLISGCERIVLVPGKLSGESVPESSSTQESSFPEYPVVLNDTEITESPQSVISLTPAYTEILCEMGYGDRLVAVSEYCDYPQSVTELPKAASGANPDIDMIKKLTPDIVITATPIVTKDRVALEAGGIKILTVPAPSTAEGFESIYKLFGLAFEGLFEGEQAGEKAFAPIKKRIEEINKTDKSFVYITAAFSPAGGDTFESAIISLFGDNCAESAKGYEYNPEKLVEDNPDIIIVNSELDIEILKNHEIYGTLDAVAGDRVIILDNSYFERPSGRITAILDELEKAFAD